MSAVDMKYAGYLVPILKGRVIALRRLVAGLPPRRPGFEHGVRSCGIYGGQSGAGAGFLRILRFPLPIPFHQLLHNHPHLSSGAGTIGQ
jgi:hypothetical protein